jgi:hypothetical protein
VPDVTHRQYDELPVHDFVLGFEGVPSSSWPALNATDKVTMIVNVDSTPTTITLTKLNLTARTVRWTPAGPIISLIGGFPFVIRITQDNGTSYTHPAVGSWTLKIVPAIVSADVVDPA